MKLKYQMPNKKHPTHLFIGNMKISQVSAIIDYLECQNIDFEYVLSCKNDNK